MEKHAEGGPRAVTDVLLALGARYLLIDEDSFQYVPAGASQEEAARWEVVNAAYRDLTSGGHLTLLGRRRTSALFRVEQL